MADKDAMRHGIISHTHGDLASDLGLRASLKASPFFLIGFSANSWRPVVKQHAVNSAIENHMCVTIRKKIADPTLEALLRPALTRRA